jgi:hypothetical protein
MGQLSSRFHCFPLLLKFLDAHEMLSVQVHPSDDPSELIPAGVAQWYSLRGREGRRLALTGGGRRVRLSTQRRANPAGGRDPVMVTEIIRVQNLGDE